MRRFVLPSLSALALLAASAAFADPAQPASTPAPAPSQAPAAPASADTTDELDKIVCRTMPPKTGSLLGTRRICRTEREWVTQREHAQKDISKMQTQIGMHQ